MSAGKQVQNLSQEISQSNEVGDSHEVTRQQSTIPMPLVSENIQIRQMFTAALKGITPIMTCE